ncbi:response regulator transcription factor [Phenylobacterium sp. J367]|uniref:response regulator transcription factor n=1 Tax=Phenylobacterium sp. J367 TaxID=2898435 RepID=UPI002151116C|nr:response regulator transcription factor [Phenylobacterium sp. J367]MCR5877708.1 response regulator transcription factor [Phenylobacterium sp. J367]
MHVLVVEDDERVAGHVVKGLRAEGWLVDHAADGRDALFQAAAGAYDVIVLDRMLPNVDGLKILTTLRASGDSTPVLILSALGDVDNRVKGLKAGGDDYLTKPFALSELIARIEVLSRRKSPVQETTELSLADLEMNLITRTVTRRGQPIDLTVREFGLLEYLLRNAGRVVSRAMLLEAVWDYNFDPQTNIIDQHVSRLRQKIDKGFDPPLLQTVRGMGYSLRA